MLSKLAELIRGLDRSGHGYSRALQAARVRASYQRAYFAPALFNLIPVKTDMIASMAVDSRWRLYYNDAWLSAHTVEENAAVLIHEVSHLLREHEARKNAAAVQDITLWNTATDCEINDDLVAEGLPLPDNPPHPDNYGLQQGENAETYYRQMFKPPQSDSSASGTAFTYNQRAALPRATAPRPRTTNHPPPSHLRASRYGGQATNQDCGSGAHGERRPWELPDDDGSPGGVPGVDPVKAELVRRECAQKILDRSGDPGDVPVGWRRWAHTVVTPKVDYMATIRHAVRKALRDSTLGRYDRTYRRPHRRQAAYGDFIMSSFYQPRPRPGFLIDTSSSMQETQLARAVAELGGLTRQLGYSTEVVVACCDAAVHDVKKVFTAAHLELYGGGGTDIGVGLRWFIDRKAAPIDLLVIVTDCQTPWPEETPPFPVITIRVGEGEPPPWGNTGANRVITIEEPKPLKPMWDHRKQRWQ